MTSTFLVPSLSTSDEEWPDADFDIPEGQQSIMPESDKEDEEDWDVEMDLGGTGGTSSKTVDVSQAALFRSQHPQLSQSSRSPPNNGLIDDVDDDEGASTIKVSGLTLRAIKPTALLIVEDDIEDAFALPSDLTQLSLRPLSLQHRSSKTSLEWGDKDHTSSSQSSDAYSNLGLHDQPSSNYTSASSPSAPEDTDEDEEAGELEGLLIPEEVFASKQGGKHLARILDMKKNAIPDYGRSQHVFLRAEEDFESGLVIEDADFSPSRLKSKRTSIMRSKSVPVQPPTSRRPPSRLKEGKTKSANNAFTSVKPTRDMTKSPPLLRSGPPPSAFNSGSMTTLLAPSSSSCLPTLRPNNLRGQKSHTGLKPPPTVAPSRRITRKASLPSLSDSKQPQQPPKQNLPERPAPAGRAVGRYDAPTAASLAKNHSTSISRVQTLELHIPPTRPSTPSTNPAALRLTMPTSSSRLKNRPPLSSVFPPSPAFPYAPRSTSPFPPRPSSASATTTRAPTRLTYAQTAAQPAPPKLLRRAKRPRTYGNGTELDEIDDLPTDAVKESLYRVAPKLVDKRKADGSDTLRLDPQLKGMLRRRVKRDGHESKPQTILSIKQASPSKPSRKKTPAHTPITSTVRKPTLIRNLGGSAVSKVVGDMKWNPETLQWEGNEQILRDFENAVPARPALITHLTGSSVGSPVGSFATGARVVGNMVFDPARMCWLSTLPPDEDEPDVFADFADDEDEWETRGGTIRASQQASTNASDSSSAEPSSRLGSPSPARSHRARAMSESESDRGSRASMVFDVNDLFLDECREAEERHRVEMKGWKSVRDGLDRTSLFEIRALATRQY